MQIEVRDSLADIPAQSWNALDSSGIPFLQYEFLYGLESTACLGKRTGWFPRYFLLWADADKTDDLIGAVATYIKTNSYGEFVFDWSWADAFERHQQPYYPKLVASIPFTPATGRRLLIRADQPFGKTASLLVAGVRQFCDAQQYSSVHWLFITEQESRLLCPQNPQTGENPDVGDHLARIDCQYHWHNNQYASFDDFLAQCTAKRRKTIRRERRFVSDEGLRLERRTGTSLTEQEWHWVHQFYESTFDRKWGNPSLTRRFFLTMGETMGEQVLIVFAYDATDELPEKPIACSVMFVGGNTLYGRYWGCRREYHSLHFEACYYQGIEHCIESGIQHFEPGAQGEHKITRGFEPTLTRSAHYIAHPGFREAIANFLQEESTYIEQRCAGLSNLLPFKASIVSP